MNKHKRPKVSSNTVKRLLSYIFHYKLRFFFVLVCILVSALTSVASSLYLQDVPLVLEMCGSSRTCVDSSAGLHSF